MIGSGRGWLSWLFINPCLGCGRRGAAASGRTNVLCDTCVGQLPLLPADCCKGCALPVGHSADGCCRLPEYNWGFRYAVAATMYAGLARQLLYRFKYGGAPELAGALADQMAQSWLVKGARADRIVPVPLHEQRLQERGYNQAECLARELARNLGFSWRNALRRTRATRSQFGLGPNQRLANLAGVFECVDRKGVRGRRVLLVDDILTSGATARTAAQALNDAGASAVDVLVFARALP